MSGVAVTRRPSTASGPPPSASSVDAAEADASLGETMLSDALAEDDFARRAERINRRLAYSAFDWRVSGSEARDSFNDLAAMSDSQQASVLATQDAKGKLDRLFSSLPKSMYKDRTEDLLRVYRNTPADALTQRTIKLLSFGVFQSSVSEAKSAQALQMLDILPEAHKNKVIMADNGKYFERLMAAEEKSKAKANKAESDTVPGATKPTLGRKVKALKAAKVLVDGKIDLDDVQALAGGTLGGLLLTDDPDANDVDIDVSNSLSTVDVDLPKLSISAMKQGSVASGAGSASGIKARAQWATKQDPSSELAISLDTLSLDDLRIGEGAEQTKIAHLGLKSLKLDGTNAPGKTPPPTSAHEARLLVAKEIFSMVGIALPNLSTVFGPWQSPDRLGSRIQKNFQSDMSLDLSIGGVDVRGLSLPNGDTVASSQLEGVRATSRRTPYRERLERQLEETKQLGESPKALARRQQLQAMLDRVLALEVELQELSGREDSGPLPKQDAERKIEITNELMIGSGTMHVDSWTAQDANVGGASFSSLSLDDINGSFSGGQLERNVSTSRSRLDEAIARRKGQAPSRTARPLEGRVTTGKLDASDVTHGESGTQVSSLTAAGTETRIGEDGTQVGFDMLSMVDLDHGPSSTSISRMESPEASVSLEAGGMGVNIPTTRLLQVATGAEDKRTSIQAGTLDDVSVRNGETERTIDIGDLNLEGVTHDGGEALRGGADRVRAGGLRMITEGLGTEDESASWGARHMTMNGVSATSTTGGSDVPTADVSGPTETKLQPLAGASGTVSVVLPIVKPIETELHLKVPVKDGRVYFDNIDLDASGLLASAALNLVGKKPVMVNAAGDLILSLRGWQIKLMDHDAIDGLYTPRASQTRRGMASLVHLAEGFANPSVTPTDTGASEGSSEPGPLDLGRVKVDVAGLTFSRGIVSSGDTSAKMYEGEGKNTLNASGTLGEGISAEMQKLRMGQVRAGDTKMGVLSADGLKVNVAKPLEDTKGVRAAADRVTLGAVRAGKRDVFS